jgi:hypothetical protein
MNSAHKARLDSTRQYTKAYPAAEWTKQACCKARLTLAQASAIRWLRPFQSTERARIVTEPPCASFTTFNLLSATSSFHRWLLCPLQSRLLLVCRFRRSIALLVVLVCSLLRFFGSCMLLAFSASRLPGKRAEKWRQSQSLRRSTNPQRWRARSCEGHKSQRYLRLPTTQCRPIETHH